MPDHRTMRLSPTGTSSGCSGRPRQRATISGARWQLTHGDGSISQDSMTTATCTLAVQTRVPGAVHPRRLPRPRSRLARCDCGAVMFEGARQQSNLPNDLALPSCAMCRRHTPANEGEFTGASAGFLHLWKTDRPLDNSQFTNLKFFDAGVPPNASGNNGRDLTRSRAN